MQRLKSAIALFRFGMKERSWMWGKRDQWLGGLESAIAGDRISLRVEVIVIGGKRRALEIE